MRCGSTLLMIMEVVPDATKYTKRFVRLWLWKQETKK